MKKFNYTRWITENKHGNSLDLIYEQVGGGIKTEPSETESEIDEQMMCEMCGGMHEGPCPSFGINSEKNEGKKKDHDGDGDIDSEDYLIAKDKAIKQAIDEQPLDTCEGCLDPNALNYNQCCEPGLSLPVSSHNQNCCRYHKKGQHIPKPDRLTVDENKSGGCGCSNKK